MEKDVGRDSFTEEAELLYCTDRRISSNVLFGALYIVARRTRTSHLRCNQVSGIGILEVPACFLSVPSALDQFALRGEKTAEGALNISFIKSTIANIEG